nr:PREDICTED: uncharacterized protein LOC105671574 isoform X1 [Linepithema humile]
MSEISVTRENVWQYYEKVSDYQAKCRFCRNEYTYTYINFSKHIKKHPCIIEYEEYKGRQEWPWICFKYNDTSTSQCLFCCENFRSNFQFLANHLKQKHSNKVESYVLYDWTWKYFAKVNDFKIECTVCIYSESCILSSNIRKHLVQKHLKELKTAQETRDIALSLETVQNLKSMEIKENMWEYYTKVTYFQVKCKFQNTHLFFNYNLQFYMHVKQKHEEICKWEEDHKIEKWPWMCFKYSYEYISDKSILFSECFLCGDFFPADKISTTTHLSDKHSATGMRNFTDNWIIKYVIQSADTRKFKCTICCKNLTIDISSEMYYHTIKSHPEELQSIISRKDTQKLWQNYKNLRNFQIQCQHCDFQYCYINTTNFIDHIKKEHIDEYNYEETNGKQWPFKFFNFISSTTVQCCLCIVIILSFDINKLETHLNLHFSKKPNYFIDCDWIWKYCKKVGDFEVECFCQRKISLDVSLWYFDHHIAATHPNRLPSTQRTHDIAKPSGSQPN